MKLVRTANIYLKRFCCCSRNEQPLSSVGYWNEPLPGSSEELCAAADPAADFRWHGLSCGGLEVASFICELPGDI